VSVEIYVALLDEGVDVWRPVLAEQFSDTVFRIEEQPYERDIETWEFGPGEEVVCEMISRSGGPFLAATKLHT
jgi:hypothetical protein